MAPENVASASEEGPKYRSETAHNYMAGMPTDIIAPEEQAQIFGWISARNKNQPLEEYLQEFDCKIKNLGLEGKKGIVLKFYDWMDRLGFYPREKLLQKKIRGVNGVANELEKAIESYSTCVDEAHTKTSDNDYTRFKAGIAVGWCDGMLERLQEEQKALKEKGKEVRAKMKNGNHDSRLAEQYNRMRAELFAIKQDLRNVSRDRDNASLYVLKTKGKSNVFYAMAIVKDEALKGLEARYHEVELRRAELETITEVGEGESLISLVMLMKKARDVLNKTGVITKDYRQLLPGLVRRLKDEQLGKVNADAIDPKELKQLAQERESAVYVEAQRVIEEDEKAELA